MRVTLQFDGACIPNPGQMAIGIVLDGPDGRLLELGEAVQGTGTSNMAEYHAIIRGIEEAKRRGASELVIRGDSNLVVQQLKGRFRVKEPRLKPLHRRVMELLVDLADVEVQWVPRDQNKQADALANGAAQATVGGASPKVGSSPSPREHSILCPQCKKPCTLTVQRFKDGTRHLRQECPDHGFVGYAPNTEPFLSQARQSAEGEP